MAKRPRRLARFPRLRTLREELGWTISFLAQRIENAPSERTLKRIEDGYEVRVETVNRVFNTIEGHHPENLVRQDEIEIIER